MSFNIEGQEWETLIEAGRNDLQSSFMRNDSLFFISSRTGTDNVYILTPDKRTITLTHSKFGTSDVSRGGKKVLFCDYTSFGSSICSAEINVNYPLVKDHISSSSFLINKSDIKINSDSTGHSTVYTPEPYRKWEHLFRFHSWMPFYADLEKIKTDPASVRPGVTIMTQNSLSTLISTIGYEYSAEKRNVIHSRITLNGWYPVIESQLDYGTIPRISKTGESVANPSVIQPGISFTNTISLPLQVFIRQILGIFATFSGVRIH